MNHSTSGIERIDGSGADFNDARARRVHREACPIILTKQNGQNARAIFSRIRLCVVIYFENTTKACNLNNQNQSKSRIVKQTKIPFQIFTFLLHFTTPTNRTNRVNVCRNHIQLPNTGPLRADSPTHQMASEVHVITRRPPPQNTVSNQSTTGPLNKPVPTAIDREVDTETAAKIIGYKRRTLEKWRLTGEGPPFIKKGRHRVLYDVRDLQIWDATRRRKIKR